MRQKEILSYIYISLGTQIRLELYLWVDQINLYLTKNATRNKSGQKSRFSAHKMI